MRPSNRCTCHGDPELAPCAFCAREIDYEEFFADDDPDGRDDMDERAHERWLDEIGGSR